MATSTKHMNLTKPDPTEVAKTVTYNADLDKIEAGRTVRGIANATIGAFQAVRYDGSTDRWLLCDDDDVVIRGIAQAAVAIGATGYFQVHGIVTNTGWAWTVGSEVFVSATAGTLTQTAPFATSRPIGMAIAATEILLYNNEHLPRLRRGLLWDIANRELVVVATSAATRGLSSEQYSADAGGANISGRKSRSATEGAHAAAQSGDALVNLIGVGSDGAAFQSGIIVRGRATELWSGTARGSAIAFFTIANTTTALVERGFIDQDGRFRWVYSFSLEGDITPTSLSANQNDYNPTSLADASCIRQASSAAVNITGLAGGGDGRIMTIQNINAGGGSVITLTADDAASAAANRFLMPANVALNPNESITFRYDSTSSRWRPVGGKG